MMFTIGDYPRRVWRFIAVAWLLAAAHADVMAGEPIRLLLVGQGPDGHPPTTHEFAAGLRVMQNCLTRIDGIEVRTTLADEPWTEGPDLLRQADAVVLYLTQGARWMQLDPRRHAALAQLAQRGGGISALHWAIGAKDSQYIEKYNLLLGACHGGSDRKFQVLETELHPATDHPATTALPATFRARDEFYYQLKLVPRGQIEPLLYAHIDGAPQMVAWAWQRPDGGRSFGFSGLHFHDNWHREEYRRLVTQGILWTAQRPIPPSGIDVSIDPDALKLN